MPSIRTNTRVQAIIAGVFVAVFMIIGLWFGAPPDSARKGTFGDVLIAFAREEQTRTIIALILIDVVSGVFAALRVGTFDGQLLAGFIKTNVLGYCLGFMLFWFLGYFGLVDLLPAVIANGIASFGYGAVMSSLTFSIIDNYTRAKAGSTPPSDTGLTSAPTDARA